MNPMASFQIGSPIVHPIHGAGILREVQEREVMGRRIDYYVIEFPFNDLEQIMVPVNMADKVGLRKITENGKLESIFGVLGQSFSDAEEEESKSFHQRYREYLEKVQSGDLVQVASVYRILYHRSLTKPLGIKDKALFETARQLLISEVVFCRNVDNDRARELLDEAMDEIGF